MPWLILGRDFAPENAAPKGLWVQGGGIELPHMCYLYAPKKSKHSLKKYKATNTMVER